MLPFNGLIIMLNSKAMKTLMEVSSLGHYPHGKLELRRDICMYCTYVSECINELWLYNSLKLQLLQSFLQTIALKGYLTQR